MLKTYNKVIGLGFNTEKEMKFVNIHIPVIQFRFTKYVGIHCNILPYAIYRYDEVY